MCTPHWAAIEDNNYSPGCLLSVLFDARISLFLCMQTHWLLHLHILVCMPSSHAVSEREQSSMSCDCDVTCIGCVCKVDVA